MGNSSYEDLRVWQCAIQLALSTYRATETFPKHETYGLTQQMRRAAISVASNITEGKGRNTDREFRQFLFNARGSLLELETQLLIARERSYLPDDAYSFAESNERCWSELGRPAEFAGRSVGFADDRRPQADDSLGFC